ncbi:MAG: hypothetical protein HY909_02470 [Deltaproteobacteria bacterium]|nr:hypothetical protein [Deltaproteobacteria bacterium]
MSVRDRAYGAVGAWFDRVAVRAALDLAARGRPQAPSSRDAWRLKQLDDVAETYGALSRELGPGGFFRAPPEPGITAHPVRPLGASGSALDLVWDSGYAPRHPGYRAEHEAVPENLTACARWLRHEGAPAPALVCVHGYLGGPFGFEERAFSARWLYERGLDVVLFQLPYHGRRCPPGRAGMFPGKDPWRTVEGLSQALWDLGGLCAHLRARGAPSVGLFGMSLGGYTVSLAATALEGLSYVVPMIPLASLADVYFEHREGRPESPPSWVRPRLERAFEAVSPLHRPPMVAPERVLVLAAEGDRITRTDHALRLQAHFSCALATFPGGHLLQFGRDRAFGALCRFLAGHGVIAPR